MNNKYSDREEDIRGEINIKREAVRISKVIFAAVLITFDLKCLAQHAGLFPGGFTGITLLLQRAGKEYFNISISYALVNFILNAVPAIISFKFIGKRFTVYSCLFIGVNSMLMDIMPTPFITEDVVLAAVFGGIISAWAVYLCLSANATSGGTDFIAIFLSERYGVDFWRYIFVGNIVILGIAGLLFGWDKALYSIVFQYASTQVLQAIYKRYKKTTLLIITKEPNAVNEGIREITEHGSTIFKGIGGYSGKECQMVYSVVSRDEIRKVISDVRKKDTNAFINILKTEQVNGNFYRRPNR